MYWEPGQTTEMEFFANISMYSSSAPAEADIAESDLFEKIVFLRERVKACFL